MMIWFWSIDFPVTNAATQAKIAQSSAIAFYQWLRDVCSWKLLQSQIVLGGPNKVVHIDESLFRHQPKVKNMFLNCCMEINISFNYKKSFEEWKRETSSSREYGSLGWWTHLRHLQLATWSWFQIEQLLHCSPLYSNM